MRELVRFCCFAALIVWMADRGALGDEVLMAGTWTDQFSNQHRLADHSGRVLVLVYGDRKASKECRALGEWLHIALHPTAIDLPLNERHLAPVRPLPGLEAATSPAVDVVPVACTGRIPQPARPVLHKLFEKGERVVPIWLDFDGELAGRLGLEKGVPHVAIFDGTGALRFLHRGGEPIDRDQLLTEIDQMRHELVAR